MCLITGHFAERPRIWIHPSSYALVASRCRWLRQTLHRDAKGYAGLGRATFVSALGKVQTTLCVALALTHGDVRLVVALLWADGWRKMGGGTRLFCESCTSVSVVRTKKNQNRPAFETVLVVLDVFLSAENLRCRDGDGGWKEQGVRELWEHSYPCKSVVEYAYRLLIIFCPSTILTPVPLCRDGRPLRS